MVWYNIFELLLVFWKTEITSVIEMALWLAIKDDGFIQMLLSTTYMKLAIIFAFLTIPIILAIWEYKKNEEDIHEIMNKLSHFQTFK